MIIWGNFCNFQFSAISGALNFDFMVRFPKMDLKSAQNQPKFKISQIPPYNHIYQLVKGTDQIWGQLEEPLPPKRVPRAKNG